MQQEENFRRYIEAFEKKLELIAIDEISSEVYCKKYLSYLLKHKKYYLAIYADVLNKLMGQSSQIKEDIVLIDFGAGNGLLGIFAKYCGFHKVFLADINEKFLQSSKQLSAQMEVYIDGYIQGGINEVQAYFTHETPTAIIGTDVIEHIYSLEDFFMTLKEINQSMVSVFTTASNPANYFKVRELKKIQVKDEWEGGTPDDHDLFGEYPLEPFIKIREQIIRNYTERITDVDVLKLAKATRGMNEQDIKKSTDQFCITGIFPVPPPGTNTCNPLNGSWTEKILSLDSYLLLYNTAGFTCKFYAGLYNEFESGLKKIVKKILNAVILLSGIKISPYIVIVGYKK